MTSKSAPARSITIESQSWRTTILAGAANYIDGGSILAGAVALPQWSESYHLSSRFLGLIAAFSANAIAAGVGALIGGYLCDRFGRKRIYQYDMLFYAFGMFWLVFAANPWMILFGFVVVGLAVGADIPASWSLIAELAPSNKRGAHSGIAQVLWYLGPLVVLLMSAVLAPLGLLGARIVFAHLLILAIALTLLRSSMQESPLWLAAKHEAKAGDLGVTEKSKLRQLLTRQHIKSIAFLVGMYGIWNLTSGTIGFFLPYILRTVGGQSQVAATTLQATALVINMASLIGIFMRLVDKVDQRVLLGISVFMQVVGISLLAAFPLTRLVTILFLLITALSGFGSPQSFYQLWSAELFPTLLRGTAQGLTFAVVRIGLGIWTFYVPLLAASKFSTLIWCLAAFLTVSGFIGVLFGPSRGDKPTLELESEARTLEIAQRNKM